jgi:hypothetical protein
MIHSRTSGHDFIFLSVAIKVTLWKAYVPKIYLQTYLQFDITFLWAWKHRLLFEIEADDTQEKA